MIERLEAFWNGRVHIIARGDNISHFINEVLRDKITLFNAQRSERGLRARIRLSDFPRLRRAAKQTHTRIRITARYGFPFVLARWWKRKGLIAGLGIILLMLGILSQMVLSITVSGNKNLDSAQIMQQAEKLGLKTFIWHRDLDLNMLATTLQEQIPDAAWIGIDRKGTHVQINIVEKKRPVIPSEAGNLVAAKVGLVQEVMVIQGIPQVHEGETVRAGQVLITHPQELVIGDKDQKQQKPPAAKGFVRGRVWYSAECKVPLVEDKIEESGKTAKGWGIKFGSRVIMVTTPNSPFPQAIKEVDSQPLFAWRNWRFPVEVIKVNYKEMQSKHYERTVSEARKAAEEKAREDVYKKITQGVQIVEEAVKILPDVSGVERVRIELETYEDLAVYPMTEAQ